MAWKKVELTEEEKKAGSGRPFKKFEAVGASALGFFVKTEPQTKTFNPAEGPKAITAYIFYGEVVSQDGVKTTREYEVTPPYDLERQLKKAMRAESEGGYGLTAGMGHLVKMKRTGSQDTGQASPMGLFELAVDIEFKPAKPLPASVVWAKSSASNPPPPMSAQDDDDIPF
jgi:hypothetical protein